MKKFVFAMLIAFSLVGCSSVKLNEPAVEDLSVKNVEKSVSVPQSTVSKVTVNSFDDNGLPKELSDPSNILYNKSVYFDLDEFIVKPQYSQVLNAHAEFLKKHKNLNITLEGHTDERGGREYNLALGQKRSEAVKKIFSVLGLEESQMEAISFGKEKPKNLEKSEEGWAENRRVDIQYKVK